MQYCRAPQENRCQQQPLSWAIIWMSTCTWHLRTRLVQQKQWKRKTRRNQRGLHKCIRSKKIRRPTLSKLSGMSSPSLQTQRNFAHAVLLLTVDKCRIGVSFTTLYKMSRGRKVGIKSLSATAGAAVRDLPSHCFIASVLYFKSIYFEFVRFVIIYIIRLA